MKQINEYHIRNGGWTSRAYMIKCKHICYYVYIIIRINIYIYIFINNYSNSWTRPALTDLIGSLHIFPGPAPFTTNPRFSPVGEGFRARCRQSLGQQQGWHDDMTYCTSLVSCFHNWWRFLRLISNHFNLNQSEELSKSSWQMCLYNMCGVFLSDSSQMLMCLNQRQCTCNVPVAWRPTARSIHDCFMMPFACRLCHGYGNVCFWDLVSRCVGIIDLTCGW